jgi:hypothetical protein
MYFERQHDPPHGGADPGYWQVHLAIEPAEQETVERAAPAVYPAERTRFYSANLVLGNDPVLAIDVYAITASEATTGATEFLEEHVMR